MPGASATIRFDLSTNDAFNLDLKDLYDKIKFSFDKLKEVVSDENTARDIIFNC